MIDIPAALSSQVTGEQSTLATCWKAQRTDGTVLGFTNHDTDLTVDGVVYHARSGYTPTQLQWQHTMAVANMELTGLFDSSYITDADIRAGKWDYAQIWIFLVDWTDTSKGVIKQIRGWFGEVRTGRGIFVAELRGLLQALQQSIGRIVAPACDVDLGSSRCGVDLTPYTAVVSVTSVTSRLIFACTTLNGQADGWFDRGKVTFTSGANAGVSMEVKEFTQSGGVLKMQLPFPYDIQVGDTFSIIPGCKKRFQEDCIAKFSNGANFQGFPDVPGIDQYMSGGLS